MACKSHQVLYYLNIFYNKIWENVLFLNNINNQLGSSDNTIRLWNS